MYYSWMVAFIYTLVYTIAILLTKYKATQRRKFLLEQKERKSTMKKGLIQNQQNLTPNPGRIDEENPTNPPTTNNTSNQSETNKINSNSSPNTKKNNHRMSESVDLTQLHQQLHTSVPYGAPVSNWECFIAILHSLDAGLHLGLLVEMIRDSQNWNLQEQYLIICALIILFYRVVSFLCVYISLPRYSYSKSIKQSQQNNDIVDILRSNNDNNGQGQIDDNIQQLQTIDMSNNKRSCLSYCWLQFFFDFGYIMELAPWLWNWEQTKIILPEFAWFSKMRTLLQSFPFAMLMVVSLLAIDVINEHLLAYFIASLFISLLTIVLSLTLYDHRTLNKDIDIKFDYYILYSTNFLYRFFSTAARIIILSFLIALFPWYLLFAILLIPIIAYSGPYQLGNSDAEPLNLIYQSLLVFPDYSAPFGKIPESEIYLNTIHKFHLFIIIVFGAPLIIIFIIVEKIVNKILKIDENSEIMEMNKEKYASFRITTYTLSRFVESTIELLIISAELYSPTFESDLVIEDAALVHALFWAAVILSIIAPMPFFKFYDDFVVDNEEDYELWYGVNDENNNGKSDPGYIMSNDAYNTNKNFSDVGNGVNTTNNYEHANTSIPSSQITSHHNVKSGRINGIIDIRGSRQYLRQKQYWIAVHRNNYKELAWVLRSRQHVNLLEYNEQEQLGIIIVALRHDWNCLKLLIKHGGGLRHLVRYAALHGEVEILTYLHETLAIDTANILDNADEALLFSAIEGSQPKVVQLLCKYGANLKGLSTEGEDPVILAAKKGELEIIKILGQNAVDLTIADDQGNTVAHYASQVYNGKHILSYLHQLIIKQQQQQQSNGNTNNGSSEHKEYGGDLNDIDYFNRQNKRGATASYNASWKGQIDNLQVLKEIGADFTISNNDGNNCLIGAAMNDQPMIVNYLLNECKLEIDYSNDCQETSLYWSASNGCIGCCQSLIKNHCNLECADKYGITPLMVAAEHGETKAVEILLNAGANPNHQNQDGETALMKACAEGFIDCVKILIKSDKIDYKICDDEGNPAILWCCMTGNMGIFQYLVSDALKLTKQDIENTINNDKETCIDWIVENKLDIGLQVLQDLGIQVNEYLDDDDDDSQNDSDQYGGDVDPNDTD